MACRLAWLCLAQVIFLLGCSKERLAEPKERTPAPAAAPAPPAAAPSEDSRKAIVRVLTIGVDGQPADAAVRATLERASPIWQRCTLSKSPTAPSGTMKFELDVDGNGRATKLRSAGGSLSDPAFANCIVAASFYSLTFESIKTPAKIAIELSVERAKAI
jgi:hypothetical protein